MWAQGRMYDWETKGYMDLDRELQLNGCVLVWLVVSMDYDTPDGVWFCERTVCFFFLTG